MPKTGETCTRSGHYKFSGHADGSRGCHPTADENDIPMSVGKTFPPIKSCKKAAIWTWTRPL